jgi:hypothetical protein
MFMLLILDVCCLFRRGHDADPRESRANISHSRSFSAVAPAPKVLGADITLAVRSVTRRFQEITESGTYPAANQC